MYQRQYGISNPSAACGPTTAAMVAQYLNDNGHSYIRGKEYYGNREWSFINTLSNELATGLFGTYETNFTYHFARYLNYDNPGKTWKVSSIKGNQDYALDTFKSRVVSGSPPPIMWHRFPWYDNAQVTWHWQAGQAYRIVNGVTEFGVREPDSTNTGTKYYPYVKNSADFLYIRLIRN